MFFWFSDDGISLVLKNNGRIFLSLELKSKSTVVQQKIKYSYQKWKYHLAICKMKSMLASFLQHF